MVRILSSIRIAAPAFVLTAALAGCADQPTRDSYVVFFDRDSVSLSPVAQAVVTKQLRQHAMSTLRASAFPDQLA